MIGRPPLPPPTDALVGKATHLMARTVHPSACATHCATAAERDSVDSLMTRWRQAGKVAVFKTVTSRSMFLPIFPLVIPPVVMKIVLATGVVAAGGAAATVMELATITACMSIGLPAALALQPLQMELDVTSLEPEFQSLKGPDGKPITHVYASKGL